MKINNSPLTRLAAINAMVAAVERITPNQPGVDFFAMTKSELFTAAAFCLAAV